MMHSGTRALLAIAVICCDTDAFHVSRLNPSLCSKPLSKRTDFPPLTRSANDVGRTSPSHPSSSSSVLVLGAEKSTDSINLGFNSVPAIAWIGILGFAASVLSSRGDAAATFDQRLLAEILRDPVNPNVNTIFYTVFNYFLPIPLILSALVIPQRRPNSLIAWPFLCGSSTFGFFALGPYLALRGDVANEPPTADVGWKNIFESKAFAAFLVALTLYLPVSSHLPEIVSWKETWLDFVTVAQQSNLVLISSVDLFFLHVTSAALVPADYNLRSPDGKGKLWAAFTLLFPFVGGSMYLLLRPSLPTEE